MTSYRDFTKKRVEKLFRSIDHSRLMSLKQKINTKRNKNTSSTKLKKKNTNFTSEKELRIFYQFVVQNMPTEQKKRNEFWKLTMVEYSRCCLVLPKIMFKE